MSQRQAFIFADLAGFTKMTDVHGDHEAAELAQSYAHDLRQLARDHDTVEVKTIGDGVLQRSPRADEALAFSVRAVNEVGDRHGSLAVKVGLDYGPAAERDGDYFGRTVNTASRVADLAQAGEVLLTGAVKGAAGEIDGVDVETRGNKELKGLSEPVEIFSAARAGLSLEGKLPLDPVCHMRVDPAQGAQTLVFEGAEYHFCSQHCTSLFQRHPQHYVDSRGCIFKKLAIIPGRLRSAHQH